MLTEDERRVLAAEHCLVDAEVAARQAYHPHAGPCSGSTAHAARVFRSHDLTPGQPSLDRLVAAITRRGWRPGVRAINAEQWVATIHTPGIAATTMRDDTDPAVALGKAFVAAVRAGEGEG